MLWLKPPLHAMVVLHGLSKSGQGCTHRKDDDICRKEPEVRL